MARSPRLCALMLGALALPAAAQAVATPGKVLPSTDVGRVEALPAGLSGPVVTIGDGVHSNGVYNGTGRQPFVQALAALPDGGTIHVGAGTYTFSEPVTIDTPRIVVTGSAAELVSSGDRITGLFDITADDVTLSRLTFRDDSASGPEHALLQVAASRVRVTECTFTGVDSTEQPVFVMISGAIGERWIQDNVFQTGIGWTCIRADFGRGLHISGNSIIGATATTGLLYGIHLVDATWTEITGNTFLNLGSEDDPVEAVILIENENGEGHHAVIADNIFHTITARRGIHLAGSQFSVVNGNAIGRVVGDQLLAMIDVDNGPQGTGAKSLVVSNNEFHNAKEAPMVRLNGIEGASVTGNQFTLVGSTAVVVGDLEAAVRVTVAGNAFGALPTIAAVPAVDITGGVGHIVKDNSFGDFLVPAIVVTGVPPGSMLVDGNLEY